MNHSASKADSGALFSRATQWRIFLSCWFIYLLHFSPFVTREVYLAMAIAERGTFQVPEYVDLHSDLFTIPGRGSFVGTNPGTSFLAAIPYWLALPVTNRFAPIRPHPPEENATIEYKEDRRNRQMFYKKVRERGLDVRLGVAALITSGFFIAPLTALSAVLMYRMFRRIAQSEKTAIWLTMLYAVGTPVFLRAGTLSLNLLVTLLALAAFYLIWWPSGSSPEKEKWRYFLAGVLGGYAVVTDYSGFISLLAIGFYALIEQWGRKPPWPAVQRTLWTVAGSLGPAVLLLWYQWHCYGNPWLPVQFHQPAEVYAGYVNQRGFGWPRADALWGLLFHAQYGLLVFAPVFALALYHPILVWRRQSRIPGRLVFAAWVYFVGLWVFGACIEYTLRHQWQDGVRYIVPALPILVLMVGEVIARMPRWLSVPIVAYSFFTSWCVAMVRLHPFECMARVLSKGPQFPWLTTLSNAARQYFPPLADPESVWSLTLPWAVLAALALGLLIIWKVSPKAEGSAA